MALTVRDVAAAAGVSASTVSRALAMPELVRPATRERVRRTADRLGYTPNRAARGLITGRTGNIGVVVPDLSNPFFPDLVKGVQARARDGDYAVFLADCDEDPVAELRLVRALAKQVDGLVLCSTRMRESDVESLARDTVIVLLNRRVRRTPAVTFDNADGMRQAVAHLDALGHRHVAWVAGPRTSWSSRERDRALHAAAAASNMEVTPVGHFPPYFQGGVAAADLAAASGATAVVTFNDLMALGLLTRLTARGIAVPDRMSIIGTDDIAMSSMSQPPLTTVGLAKEAAGRSAVDLLLSLLDRPDGTGTARRELPTQLVVRGSTGVAHIS